MPNTWIESAEETFPNFHRTKKPWVTQICFDVQLPTWDYTNDQQDLSSVKNFLSGLSLLIAKPTQNLSWFRGGRNLPWAIPDGRLSPNKSLPGRKRRFDLRSVRPRDHFSFCLGEDLKRNVPGYSNQGFLLVGVNGGLFSDKHLRSHQAYLGCIRHKPTNILDRAKLLLKLDEAYDELQHWKNLDHLFDTSDIRLAIAQFEASLKKHPHFLERNF
jgi:hypothetical protein